MKAVRPVTPPASACRERARDFRLNRVVHLGAEAAPGGSVPCFPIPTYIGKQELTDDCVKGPRVRHAHCHQGPRVPASCLNSAIANTNAQREGYRNREPRAALATFAYWGGLSSTSK